MEKTTVVIIDASPIFRSALRDALNKTRAIQVVALASDPKTGHDRVSRFAPQALVMDPGPFPDQALDLLKHLELQSPIPVFIIAQSGVESGHTAVRAMNHGALAIVPRPEHDGEMDAFAQMLADKIIAACKSSIQRLRRRTALAKQQETPPARLRVTGAPYRILAIGASTGGTEAVKDILVWFPENCPATIVVVHMPEKMFTGLYAERLNKICSPEVREARAGDVPRPGLVLVAPGGRHTVLKGKPGTLRIGLEITEPMHHQRPAVDMLFHSVARCAGPHSVGVLLTGMGSDGAQGLLAMRQAGAATLAQDQDSSVVYGMPKVAADIGAAQYILPLDAMAPRILSLCMKP